MRRIAWSAAAVAVVVVAAAFGRTSWWSGAMAGSDVSTFTLVRAPFVRRISADGYLRAVKATPLSAPPTNQGPLKIAWLLPDGSPVHAGDVVMRFDPSDLEKKLKDGEADRASAVAKAQKEQTETAAALRGRDRTAALSDAELQKTRAFASKDPLIFSRNQIIEAQIDESLSTERKSHAVDAQKIEGRLSASKLDLLALERRKAEIAIQQAQKGLAGMALTAPHDGLVVFEPDWRGSLPRVGDPVWPGQRLGNLPLLDEMEAEAYVLEADAGGLAAGLPAKVVLESHPETVYQARIKRVDTLAKPRIRDVPINYFAVTLALERTDKERMKPGARVHATLVLDQARALAAPRQAVFERAGRQVVFVARSGGRFEEVPVQLGASSPGMVILESGAREGERIALRDPTRPSEPPRKNAAVEERR